MSREVPESRSDVFLLKLSTACKDTLGSEIYFFYHNGFQYKKGREKYLIVTIVHWLFPYTSVVFCSVDTSIAAQHVAFPVVQSRALIHVANRVSHFFSFSPLFLFKVTR